ncbi:hypothetical protein, partial [Pseudarthrobacter sulfonivorans]|uniref:hypothetical protein n=1 Tax=Pseudarthrobacter sulfonivorans TaxID=121292 RepID=UPI0031D27808
QTGEEASAARAKSYLQEARAAYMKLKMPRHAALCDLEPAQVSSKRSTVPDAGLFGFLTNLMYGE